MADWKKDFVDEGEGLFFGGASPRASQKIKVNWLGGRKAKAASEGGSMKRAGGIAGVRAKLTSLVKPAPQVMVKVTGWTRGAKHLAQHLDYISRNGELDGGLEDQDGNLVEGRDDLNALKQDWKNSGYPILTENSTTRDTYSVIFSMPSGTDPLAVKRAVRDLAAIEFAGYQYVMALHTQDTDPDPKPSPHPHVHVTIKARSMDEGHRLNPQKADLHRWREGFAESLRNHGVEATATTRSQRLKRKRGDKQYARYIEERKEKFKKIGKTGASKLQIARSRKTEKEVRERYAKVLASLASSPDVDDKRLADAVKRHLVEKVPTEVEKPPVSRDRSRGL